MSTFIAALPMYEWPETRAQTDAEWSRFRAFFQRAGIDAPQGIVRRNAEMPAVPGGIRDGDGAVIAPDPAMLPPDELDFQTLWRHPQLLLCQTCWGPMELGLAAHVQVVGQPSYKGFEGGQGPLYSSAILMRRSEAPPSVLPDIPPSRREITPSATASPGSNLSANARRPKLPISPLEGEMAARPEGGNAERDRSQDIAAPSDGQPITPLDLIRGKRFAYNSLDSMSGYIAPTRDLQAMGESLGIFSDRIETGSHRDSIVAVAEGKADVCAIDCRSWHMAKRHEPKAEELRVVGWTALRKGLPMITSVHTPEDIREQLIEILSPA